MDVIGDAGTLVSPVAVVAIKVPEIDVRRMICPTGTEKALPLVQHVAAEESVPQQYSTVPAAFSVL